VPALPAGLSMDVQHGVITGMPSRATARRDYKVTLENPAGKTDCTISLEVQEHKPPAALLYEPALRAGAKLNTIFVVNRTIKVEPTDVDLGNHLVFSVSPALPPGLTLNPNTAVIEGTHPVALEKITVTVTARNKRGQQSTQVAFAVAEDWQTKQMEDWSVEMCQVWMRDELGMDEQDRLHLSAVDGAQLIKLQSKQAVASNFPALQPGQQNNIASSVKALLQEQKNNSNDRETEALIEQVKAAAEKLGLQVQVDDDVDKYTADKLVMGLPPDAGRGINPFLNYAQGEEALLTQAGRG